ncbi:MAG: hypothetical protein QM479_07665 [Pseudomonadota bacterium]
MYIIKLLLALILVITAINSYAEEELQPPKVTIWKKSQHGAVFSIQQILPDIVRAFYIGRGFTLEQIKPYAESCVFTMTLLNDQAPGIMHFLRSNWSITSNGKSHAPRKTSDWLEQLKQDKVKMSGLIAFRFAQFPEEQEYQPNGDWNQGMLNVNLPIGSQFDITLRWDVEGKPYKLTLPEVKCIEKSTN